MEQTNRISRLTRRWRFILAIVIALAFVVAVGLMRARRMVRLGWPQTEGTVALAGLSAPVTVVRDRYGVPHIFAENEADFFLAQGYVHAQDRFWQMELNRRRGSGALVELIGEKAEASDEAWRALDLESTARRELAKMDAASLAALDAYAAGVNAWLKTHQEGLPFEFTLLRLQGRDVDEPAPWTPQDSLTVALVVGSQAAAPRLAPSLRAQIVDRVGVELGGFLLGDQPGPASSLMAGTPFALSDAVPNLLPGTWTLGSQVIVVESERTDSGKPLWAVDLPTGLDLPTPWYVMAGRVDVARGHAFGGASLPGVPGLVVSSGDGDTWQTWAATGRLSIPVGAPPWQEWLLAALLNSSRSPKLGDESTIQTLDALQARLTDTFSARAARLIPLLVRIQPRGWRQERVTGMLHKWDYRIGDNNKEGPFFAVYQLELARAAFADELGEDLFEAYVAASDLYQSALDSILENPVHEWWDDVNTSEREQRDDIVERAYEPALEWIGRNYGDLHMLWEWDIVHGTRLHHILGDIWPWDQLLSQDLYPDGWSDTMVASPGGLPCVGGICMGGDLYRATAVYGYRQIIDASDPATLWFTLLPGQSGHPFHPHYDDLQEAWLNGEYLPLHLEPTPEALHRAESVLVLTPAGQ